MNALPLADLLHESVKKLGVKQGRRAVRRASEVLVQELWVSVGYVS
jgi:hypothetical protein